MSAQVGEASPVYVNGVCITSGQINTEVQYHPSKDLRAAREAAKRALVVRELLLQEAQKQGMLNVLRTPEEEKNALDALLEREIKLPEPTPEECQRYYESNKTRFVTSPIFDVGHILIACKQEDQGAFRLAHVKAEEILLLIKKDALSFEEAARKYSACSSAKNDGRLGQISKGQTTPEFEQELFKMARGDISKKAVLTRFGYHLIKVYECEEGRQLDFPAVKDWIANYLRQMSWQKAVSQYIGLLAGKADIKGFQVKGFDTPLVQ